jgi:DNA adenine methylase
LLKYLLSDIPEHTCYVEAFAGGAALLMAKEPSPTEILNDLHSELVRLYRCVQHHLDELVRQFRWSLVSREMFKWAQMQHVETLTDIQRAARFYYLQRLSFGGKVAGQTFGASTTGGPRLNLLRVEEELSQAHLRLMHVTIEHLPWQEVVARYDRPGTLFFFDPPYWRTAGYGMPFPREEYDRLAEVMRGLQGKAILTINDHPDLRPLWRGFRQRKVAITYTAGGAQAGKARAAAELIVRSWKS